MAEALQMTLGRWRDAAARLPWPKTAPWPARRALGAVTAAPAAAATVVHDRMLNREISWLAFNARVLHQATDARLPLLERIKFLAISDSNLDEFLMKRVGRLLQRIEAADPGLSPDGLTASQELAACTAPVMAMLDAQSETLAALTGLLAGAGVRLVGVDALSEKQRQTLRKLVRKQILPALTPQAIDRAHPFPFIANLSLNLLLRLRPSDGGEAVLARVGLPVGADTPRLLAVDDAFVRIEDAVRANLDLLFPGLEVMECGLFRLVRSVSLDIDADDDVEMTALVESELQCRRFAPVVAIRVGGGMGEGLRDALREHLALDAARLIAAPDAAIGMRDLMELMRLPRPDLRDPPHAPQLSPLLADKPCMFRAIARAGTILLRHPYESFDASVQRFVEQAARDPDVRTIKMTLYRAAGDSPLIAALIDAARQGKEVVVVVELKARFDEAANLRWSQALRAAGAQVSHGVLGLKTHCKTILVLRREKGALRRYAHLGTGNYHGGTAKLYGDVGLLTDDAKLTADIAELFNHLTTGWGAARPYRRLLTAPRDIKSGLIARIDREIGHAQAGRPALIQLKVNALEDPQIVEALYRAAQGGVKVDLIVRDICRLRPGLPGLSDGVRVVSLVGRFLEHARIWRFANGGEAEVMIGSADLMRRNLERRVEVMAPVDDRAARARLCAMLDAQLADTRLAWTLGPDGRYAPPPCADESDPGSQYREIGANATRGGHSGDHGGNQNGNQRGGGKAHKPKKKVAAS